MQDLDPLRRGGWHGQDGEPPARERVQFELDGDDDLIPVEGLRVVRPDDDPQLRTQWSGRVSLLLGHEIRYAVATAVLTVAEAEQLLARLKLVIDQALTPARP